MQISNFDFLIQYSLVLLTFVPYFYMVACSDIAQPARSPLQSDKRTYLFLSQRVMVNDCLHFEPSL